MKEWIGLDIGGANIKIAFRDQQFSFPFELWKQPEQLSDYLRTIVTEPERHRVAVTMTGELADGYPTKSVGVREIVRSVERAFPDSRYYQTSGEFVGAEIAVRDWLKTAAANWHATAVWFANLLGLENGFVVDIGSTTTDIVPVQRGIPCGANTDVQRLVSGQLLYTGVKRSSVAGIVPTLELGGQSVVPANESFATIEDAYVLLGEMPERDSGGTADGRSQTKTNAARRIARMLCADVEELGRDEVDRIANQISLAHRYRIRENLERVVNEFTIVSPKFMVCGEGEWLACQLLDELTWSDVRRLSKIVSPATANCAAAVAVREMARKEETYASCR